jgi:hypothetical protein
MEEHILQFFAYEHLPKHLGAVSKPFAELANLVVYMLPRNPERTVALRKLLEAKDAAVRAKLAKDVHRPSDPSDAYAIQHAQSQRLGEAGQ